MTYYSPPAGGTPVLYYYLQDANWNVVALLDTNADDKELYTYDPYGRPTFHSRTWSGYITWGDETSSYGTDFLFQGRWYEYLTYSGKSLRLYHFRHRAYGPELGRFLQRDPIDRWDGNSFEFCTGSPLGWQDPAGLQARGNPGGTGSGANPVQKAVEEGVKALSKSLERLSENNITVEAEKVTAYGKKGKVNLDAPDCNWQQTTLRKEVYHYGARNGLGMWIAYFTIYLKYNYTGCDVEVTLDRDAGDFANGFNFASVRVRGTAMSIKSVPGKCKCCEEAACVEYTILVSFNLRWYAIGQNDAEGKFVYKVCGDGTVQELPAKEQFTKNFPGRPVRITTGKWNGRTYDSDWPYIPPYEPGYREAEYIRKWGQEPQR